MLFRVVVSDYKLHGSRVFSQAFFALLVYRFGRWALFRKNIVVRKILLKMHAIMNAFVTVITKLWIPPEVSIGDGFHIIHAEGSLSIHPNVVIGNRVGVMHNVTIGTNMSDGVPVIGDDVFIGVNSTILGKIKIGDRVRIAANTAVTTNVPSDSVVVGSPAKIYRRLTPFSYAEKDRIDAYRASQAKSSL